ncbi:Abi-alpha family protein [Alcaligenes faecalis]|uniref:Abi-alpha family protein n=1 Tax=Alcaligenes aquatilis TaxID=323284 RepID=UPI002AA95861|nr:Abi-alpha family protein [Alcaligenes faecalis]
MGDEEKKNKIDISSTAVEKGIDIAKSFVDKLVLPPIEELGLLVRDQISYWRFRNQIKILNKSKAICEKNNVNIKAIPPKILCPYLENASLEDDDELQDKWAILLVNMADSQQNIQNHVFPYILSQLSKEEFNLLDFVLREKERRVSTLNEELKEFLASRAKTEIEITSKLTGLKQELESMSPDGKYVFSAEAREIRSSISSIERELRLQEYREFSIKLRIDAPQKIPEQNIKEFEMANIIRLGLAKVVYEVSAGTHSIKIPRGDYDHHTSVDFDIDIDTETSTILTELGALFIEACREKHA